MKNLKPLLAALALIVARQVFAAEKLEPGLLGEYFDIGSSLEDFPVIPTDKRPVVKRVDKTIDFESTQEGFHGTQLVDFFYIRWTGKIRIPKDGNYTFTLESDDGSRLFIDGKQIIDHNGLHAMEEKSAEAGTISFEPPGGCQESLHPASTSFSKNSTLRVWSPAFNSASPDFSSIACSPP